MACGCKKAQNAQKPVKENVVNRPRPTSNGAKGVRVSRRIIR